MNAIKSTCNFCKTPHELTWEKREHKCPTCGTRYIYRPNVSKNKYLPKKVAQKP